LVWIAVIIAVGSTIYWGFSGKRGSNVPAPITPTSSVAESRRQGAALFEQGRYADAVKEFERALAVEDDVPTRIDYANALKKLGRSDEAEAQYRRVLAGDPRNATAWFNLGNSLRDERHDTRGAVEAFRHATESDPDMAVAHFSLGAALIDLGDYEAAIASIQAALQLAPENAPWRKDAENALTLAHVRDAEKKGLLQPPGHK
jgi:tetratricopeptide (TPR) repeat protein